MKMKKQYFTPAYRDFFLELEQNNHKAWFYENKKRYEEHVKAPFKALVTDIISALQKKDACYERLEAKQCIGRINRDIRFSKDKTPYQVYMNATISSSGRKNIGEAGIAFRIGANTLWIAGGIYMPEKGQLTRIRTKIAQHPQQFRELIEEPKFKGFFGDIQGEKNKRLPKEFQEAMATEPLIANKQFYYMRELEDMLFMEEDLLEFLLDACHLAMPVNKFLSIYTTVT